MNGPTLLSGLGGQFLAGLGSALAALCLARGSVTAQTPRDPTTAESVSIGAVALSAYRFDEGGRPYSYRVGASWYPSRHGRVAFSTQLWAQARVFEGEVGWLGRHGRVLRPLFSVSGVYQSLSGAASIGGAAGIGVEAYFAPVLLSTVASWQSLFARGNHDDSRWFRFSIGMGVVFQ